MASVADADAVALTCWGEARGEPVEGQIAVACVLRNRLRSGKWGATYDSVAHAPKQFSCWSQAGGMENFRKVMTLQQQIADGALVDDAAYAQCRWIADGLLTGRLQDRVQGATHYFEVSLQPVPAWAVNRAPVCRIGSHVFFRDIP